MIGWILKKLFPVPETPRERIKECSLKNARPNYRVTHLGDPERHRLQSKANLKALQQQRWKRLA